MITAATTSCPPLRCSNAKLLLLAATGLASLWLTGCATVQAPPKALAVTGPQDDEVQLQILLDAQHFGPGVVDGHAGEFTKKALAFYRQAKGLAPDAQPDVSGIQPYTTYTITADDLKVIGTMATEPADIAKQARLPYTSLVELLGERFHTTQAFIKLLNPSQNIDALPAGSVVTVPNIDKPFRADRFTSNYPAPPASVAGTRRVIVDTHERMLQVREGDRLIAAFPITPGSSDHPAPIGEWRVVGAVPWPWYRYDEGVLDRGERTATFFQFPPGPNSPVGILWTGLNRPGVGIHGTTNPETIGRAGSHGCIRLANWDAAAFYTLVQKNMPVTIQ